MERQAFFIDWKVQHIKDVNPSQMTYSFNAVPIKTPARFFVDIDKIIIKFTWKRKGTRIAKTVLKRKSGRNYSIQFQAYYVVTGTSLVLIGRGTDM